MTMPNIKRFFVKTLALLPVAALLSACKATAMGQRPQLSPTQKRMDGMGLTLVVDAVEGAEMLGVEFFADGNEFPFFAKSRMVRTNREIMAFPSGVVPERVRVTWRKNASEGFYDKQGRIRYSAPIVGDYTFPVASRIPEEVVREIRKNGGGLRLKFRLKPDGVLFGWDIERFSGGLPRHSMPGGDFLETWY
ncbi:hypothetical protein [Limnohabitans sp.]|jgi:hypothetical protein